MPWTAARQASLSITISWSLLKLTSLESVMPSNRLILWCCLLPPSAFPRSGSFPTREGICLQTRPRHTAQFTASDPFSSFMHEKTAGVSLALTIPLHSFYRRHVFYTFGLLASPPPTCSSPGGVWPGRVGGGVGWVHGPGSGRRAQGSLAHSLSSAGPSAPKRPHCPAVEGGHTVRLTQGDGHGEYLALFLLC